MKDFKRKALRELGKIQRAWPEFRYRTVPGYLVLILTRPRIEPISQHPCEAGSFHAETAPPRPRICAETAPPRPRICAETAPPTYR